MADNTHMDTITVSSETLLCTGCDDTAIAVLGEEWLCADHILIELADLFDVD